MKALIIFLTVLSTFAQTKIPLNNEGAEKYFTEQEMDRALAWEITLDGARKPKSSKIPMLKLYDNKELKGKEIGEIKEDGLFLNGEKICRFALVWGGLNILINEKPLEKDELIMEDVQSFGVSTLHLCEAFPLRRPKGGDSGSEGTAYDMRIRVYDGKVGKYDHGEITYFFDLKDVLSEATHVVKDTETILQENLSDEEMKALNVSLVELRDFVREEDLEKLYKIIEDGDDLSFDFHHRQRFLFKTRKDFFQKVIDKKKFFNFMMKATYSKYSINENSAVGRNKLGKSLRWSTEDFELRFIFTTKGQWKLSAVGPYYLNK